MAGRLRTITTAGAIAAAVLLGGCSAGEPEAGDAPASESSEGHAEHEGHDGHAGHDGHDGHDHAADGGPPPAGIAESADPTYPVGTEVTLTADHMPGMDGATATIVGAFDTVTYAVDFTPTTGGDPIEDHRWVVQEEIVDAGADVLPDGAEVTLAAEHMTGMDGATATIASSTQETVYMVDVEADGMTMTNHKWVVESEIRPAS